LKYLFVILSLTTAQLSYGDSCQAPGQSFLEEKLKASFSTEPAEKELKDIALDPKNYELREEVKNLSRRSRFANRFEIKEIETKTNDKFAQMIGATRKTNEIENFPVSGATSRLTSETDSLAIEVNNVSKEDLDVLPAKVLEKLSNKVKIRYMYPYDKFEYVLTYDGREFPMQKALAKMQVDFEDACEDRLRENLHTRDLHSIDRKSRGLGEVPVSISNKKGSAAQ
jgi:hypothetical protein